jgi:uncharacterized membrane protein (UPF0136 family)
MFKAFSTSRGRILSFALLGLCVILGVIAALVGIADNPPGLVLAFLASCAFITAFIHHWRRSRTFLYFVLAALGGFIVAVFLHNAFEALGTLTEKSAFFSGLFNGLGGVFFFLAIFLCPAGFLVGLVGLVVTAITEDHKKASPPSAQE